MKMKIVSAGPKMKILNTTRFLFKNQKIIPLIIHNWCEKKKSHPYLDQKFVQTQAAYYNLWLQIKLIIFLAKFLDSPLNLTYIMNCL